MPTWTLLRRGRSWVAGAVVLLALLASVPKSSAKAGVLETIRTRGHLVCGVGNGLKGYSAVNGNGTWAGISVDFCRALAAAVLGNKDAVKFVPLPPGERFSALQSGEIDILSRNATLTSSHDTGLGIRFPGVLVYDGQGFWLCQKRLSSGRFPFWPDGETPTRALEACELQLLLMGGDPRRAHAAPAWRPLSLAA